MPDRAYDWFDADSSFFRVLQGTSDREIGGVEYILRGYERFDEKLRKLGASVQRVPSRSYATV